MPKEQLAATMVGKSAQPLALGYAFSKFYRNDTITNGLSLSSIGTNCISAGFSPETHRILAYYCTEDIATVMRALRGENSPLVEKDASEYQVFRDSYGNNVLQPVHVGSIFRAVTDLASLRLEYVHAAFCGRQGLTYREAPADTSALRDICLHMLDKTKAWFPHVYYDV
ncbi:hypothetical protein CC80DRAFT_537678 [Byssothecium circinans]|uniref:Uncharacterized protein n=1 Tax=Byssothecium circinans TaxID=147558 RepID=A0A6A5TQS1_9PLEO|nr:hypothetical protein CC80DRAFT_537678 [Byssothecium circinans]